MQLEQTLELTILLPPTAQILGLHESTTMSYLDYLECTEVHPFQMHGQGH